MILEIPATAALWFLPFAIPIGLWVAWSDMAFMKIPNKSVIALVAVYAVVGLIALPFDLWAWQWLHLVVVLVVGFLLNQLRLIGAGDAKFAAAMAPFISLGDISTACYIYVAASLGALASHRILRSIPAVRSAAPNWKSWEQRKFPMGLALGGMLIVYLVLGALYGR